MRMLVYALLAAVIAGGGFAAAERKQAAGDLVTPQHPGGERLGKVARLPAALGDDFTLVREPAPMRLCLLNATLQGRVRTVWTGNYYGFAPGFSGSNDTSFGIIDTGVDSTHMDLTNRCLYWKDQSTDAATTNIDMVQHGTHVAGIALGIAVIPVIFSISEDALTSVPRTYSQAALALGASRWQTAWQIVLPAALPGVFAASVLGFGRAIGETMIVLMVCSGSVVSWSIFDSARSITTTIAAEMAEAVDGGPHYRILFMLGALLFAATFISNMIGDLVIHRFKQKLEGKR